MISKLSVLLLAAVLVFGQSCSTYDAIKVDAAERLWGDIPQVEGSRKIDMGVPLAATRELHGLQAKHINYVAYSTGRTAAEVESIYSTDRMADAGWKSASKCLGGAGRTTLSHGAVCIYYRTADPKNNMLAIHIAEDPNTRQTVIYYMRFQLVFDDEKDQLAR